MKNQGFLEKLNPPQREAVEHVKGPLLVFAGAGSGKTRVITYRIANLIANHGIRPENILAVTFTKKAAEEMKERISKIFKELGIDQANLPAIGTFHSICAQILRKEAGRVGLGNNFSIYDTDDSETLVKELMLAADIDVKQFKPSLFLSMIGSAKNDMVGPDQYSLYYSGYVEDMVASIYPKYQDQLLQLNSVDFADLLFKAVQLLEKDPDTLKKYQDVFKYVLVDEYQDTNKVQYTLIRLITQEHNNLCVVGDDDQSIYKWRGADIKNIISFEKDYADVKVIKLEQNYRSTNNIINAAVSVIKKNNERVEKSLWTEQGQGDPITVYQARDEKEEALYIVDEVKILASKGNPLGDMAVLYRTNYQSRVIEEALLETGIPYRLVGGFRFYDRKEIKDLLSYVKFLNNPKDDVSLYRVLNIPNRKMGPKSISDLVQLAKDSHLPTGSFIILANILLNKHDIDPIQHGFTSPQVSEAEKVMVSAAKFSTVISLFGDLYLGSEGRNILEIIDSIISRIKYIEFIDDGSDAGTSRRENVQELRNVASRYAEKDEESSLHNFLTDINLIEQEQEKNKKEGNTGAITLMTLHSSKGLEFPYIFMPGMEEGLLPHSRTFTEPLELEEERRLCYVGITRAQKRLWMTFAEGRSKMGGFETQIPSRFLGEIPQDICEYYSYSY